MTERAAFADPLSATPGDIDLAARHLRKAGSESCQRVALALERILRGADPTIALGLRNGESGQRSPLTIWRLQYRDDRIRTMARNFWAELCAEGAARKICREARAYERSCAAIDSHADKMPDSYAGRPRALLFELYRAGLVVPKERTVRGILARPVWQQDPAARSQ